MKKFVSKAILTMATLTVFTSLYAAGPASTPPASTPPAATPPAAPSLKPKTDTITTVDAQSITITHMKKGAAAKPPAPPTQIPILLTYKITGSTIITIDNTVSKVENLKPGMEAHVIIAGSYALPNHKTGFTAAKITVTTQN